MTEMGAEIIKLTPEQGQALDKRDASMVEMTGFEPVSNIYPH